MPEEVNGIMFATGCVPRSAMGWSVTVVFPVHFRLSVWYQDQCCCIQKRYIDNCFFYRVWCFSQLLLQLLYSFYSFFTSFPIR